MTLASPFMRLTSSFEPAPPPRSRRACRRRYFVSRTIQRTAHPVKFAGRGRPRVAYRATPAAGDEGGRRYQLLAEILTALVARFGPEAGEQLEEIGDE